MADGWTVLWTAAMNTDPKYHPGSGDEGWQPLPGGSCSSVVFLNRAEAAAYALALTDMGQLVDAVQRMSWDPAKVQPTIFDPEALR